ncbi:YukJ family protein [Sporolactobacillus sp. CQH2019]|uniref:YukJ family protein n=1 Tax=Sporolactobacillus sp. CQH2019 TaxID=3023512 RepID=UPI0023688134|nr:YukJ family protein [Sporolactobacillus sp. CQH2019]MDD9150641.1 YukJ family protein [Sporolactobacillus sp. CQH2019]
MPLKNYGVLKGEAAGTIKAAEDKSHYQILIKDGEGTEYRVAVNIKSQTDPSKVLYFATNDFRAEETARLSALESGFTSIRQNHPDIGLDFIRGNLFDPGQMIPLPADAGGSDNDLNEKIQDYIKEAMDKRAIIYAFGDRWGPELNQTDPYFGFSPGNGIHDIHMNQGNVEKYKKDDGTWQDGGLLIYFEREQRWAAIFLAFQSQSWCTDQDGHALKSAEECGHDSFIHHSGRS